MSVHLNGTVDAGLPHSFGDPARLETLAAQLDALAEQVLGLGHDGLSATAGIAAQARWTGTAADAYLEFCRGRTNAVGSLSGPLHEIAAAVRGYAAQLATQQSRVHNAVRSVEGIRDPTVDAHPIAQAEWQVIEATGEVHTALYQATNVVEAAKGELDRVAADPQAQLEQYERGMWPWDLAGHPSFAYGLLKPTENAAEWLDTQWRVDPQIRQGVATVLGQFEVLDAAMGVAGFYEDHLILKAPTKPGVFGKVDKAAAWVQGTAIAGQGLAALAAAVTPAAVGAGLIEANTLDWVPVAGQVMLAVDVGVGVYLGARYVAEHRDTVTSVFDTVGHAEVSLVKSEVKLASGAVHAVTSSVRSWLRL